MSRLDTYKDPDPKKYGSSWIYVADITPGPEQEAYDAVTIALGLSDEHVARLTASQRHHLLGLIQAVNVLSLDGQTAIVEPLGSAQIRGIYDDSLKYENPVAHLQGLYIPCEQAAIDQQPRLSDY